MLICAHIERIQPKMTATLRQDALLNLLQPDREIPVQDIARKLGTSESTIRRDLCQLSEIGRVRRTHGGALLRRESLQESSFMEKRATAVSAKQQIARRVALDIPLGSTIFIDAGTTCLEAARELLRRSDCRIFTNSLPILVEACNHQAGVTALGGEVRGISRALIGSGALSGLDSLRVDIALIGASGLHPDEGAFTTEPMEAGVKTRVIQRAHQSWLLADHSKWQHAAALRFAEWPYFQRWYVESDQDIDFSNRQNGPELRTPTLPDPYAKKSR